MTTNLPCPICNESCSLHDVVDFNKSCEEGKGKMLPRSGVPIHYFICLNCGFCFAPEIMKWGLDEFAQRIYNDDYILVDPEFMGTRPKNSAANLIKTFGAVAPAIKHLDFGGGDGLLSKLLRESSWDSISYDPFVNTGIDPGELGRFNLITAIEVFEHVPDVNELMSQLLSLLSDDGLILFSTLVSDGHIHPHQKLTWWYAAPRNGHISLFSNRSLALLAHKHGFDFGSFSPGFHAFSREIPSWANHIIK